MTARRNILFIMADQLRADYLGCAGHPSIRTPHIDALAARGMRFDRAYCQSAVCGASRMSFYTGRYVRAHGATWNDTPLDAGEMTLGDHLGDAGMRTMLVGKTHVRADLPGMARLGIDPQSARGRQIAEGGFEPVLRDEGIYPATGDQSRHMAAAYNRYLAANGYPGDNPWLAHANSVDTPDGPMNGWYLDASSWPARVKAEHSETAWLTRQGIAAIDDAGDQPWCLHLSYIKPHWPYVAPAPYHAAYAAADVPAAILEARAGEHPVLGAFRDLRVSRAFADPAVRSKVVPAYMGLVQQLDDAVGQLVAALAARNLLQSTLIVFTSDHGDYLGDHGLGEKDFAHEVSVRIPLIIVDPGAAADATRGTACKHLIESIDLAPTFVDFGGGDARHPRLEGRSLLPLLHGNPPGNWRKTAFSEYDYSALRVRHILGQAVDRANFVVAIGERFKLVHFPDFPPMLFDLEADPEERCDLGASADHAPIRNALLAAILDWALRPRRVTESVAAIERRTDTQLQRGIWLGLRNAAEHAAALEAERAETASRWGKAVG